MATMKVQLKTLLALWVFVLVVLATMAQDVIQTRDPITDLDTVQTARRNGYPAESHTVQTADGYLLAVHRIPGESHSRTNSRSRWPPSRGAATAAGAAAAPRPGAGASSPGASWAETSSSTTAASSSSSSNTTSSSATNTATGLPPSAPGLAPTNSVANTAAHSPPPRLLRIPSVSTRRVSKSPRTTTTRTTTCRICTPVPLRALTTTTSAPSSGSRSAAAASSGAASGAASGWSSGAVEAVEPAEAVEAVEVEAVVGAVGVEAAAAAVEGRWSASAPTTPTKMNATMATTEIIGIERETEKERGSENEKEREKEVKETGRESSRAVGATSSSTATTWTNPFLRRTSSHPGSSTDASSQTTLAAGMALRARMWVGSGAVAEAGAEVEAAPHTLRIRRRRSAAPAVSSWPPETSTTTTAPSSWTAAPTRPTAATTATTTTTSAADASAATRARANTRTSSTRWSPRRTTPLRRTPPPARAHPRSSTPSPSPRTTSPTRPPPPSPPPSPRTRSSPPKSAASTAIDASSESLTDIPIGRRTLDTSTTTEGTTLMVTSRTTTTTSYEGYTSTDPYVDTTTTTTTTVPPRRQKPVVFLQHGLMGSSYDWVLAGPGNALAYLLADAGFDVWMGNARGNTYSRAHVYLPTKASSPFWDFSFHEMAVYDLPAELEYILNVTGARSLHYVGHSMGTTMFFVMAAMKPEVARGRVASMHALAPVAFVQHLKGPLRLLAPQVTRVQFLVHWLGLGEFLPQNFIIKWLTKWGCEKLKIEEDICENFMFVLCGFDKQQFNESLLPALLSHTPAGASTQTILHYAQLIDSGKFRQYDYGLLDNRRKYGSDEPPPYNLSRVDVPLTLMYSDNDWLADVEDMKRLYKSLECEKQLYKVPFAAFNHLDFIMAKDVKRLVNERILRDLLLLPGERENESRENESRENDITANSVFLH